MAPTERIPRLFRAIVVLGASLTTNCGDSAPPPVDAHVVADATIDAPAPKDALVDADLVDTVIIL
ncbi:MAG: hypothetical protein NT062_03540 [Proteobacteria bacterium]|nr:hypothetical protein [Pseudomonadota bacterium]